MPKVSFLMHLHIIIYVVPLLYTLTYNNIISVATAQINTEDNLLTSLTCIL